jgi:very-short-patch-repair endonuclease
MKSSIQRARVLRKNLTDAEQLFWQHLRLRQINGYKFRRQRPIGSYIVDFVCLEKRLIIELDGGQHAEKVKYDTERDTWLEAQGFTVLRFWNNEVIHNIDGVKETILKALQSCPFIVPSRQLGRTGRNAKTHLG